MTRTHTPGPLVRLAGCLIALAGVGVLAAQQPLTPVAAEVNKKLVKLYGAGGFKGLPSYGTGILVSPRGHILTVNNHLVSTQGLRVHLYDGRSYQASLVAREPELDAALVKIDDAVDFLPCFEFDKVAGGPPAEVGDFVLAFSNPYNIATRDEPMTMQRGVVAAFGPLRGRKGVFEAPYSGDVYFVDTVTNNPGSAGGALTNRTGHLIGLVGRELKNSLSDTWINYAVPVQAVAEVRRGGKTDKVSLNAFVREAIAGTYKEGDDKTKDKKDRGGYHGIILVVNAVSNTPPYVEEVVPTSPAAKAGLHPDDLIVYVDGELVGSIKAFRDVMRQHPPGTEVKLEVQRGNRLESVKLKLAEHPKLKAGK
jgi:serine protease Do